MVIPRRTRSRPSVGSRRSGPIATGRWRSRSMAQASWSAPTRMVFLLHGEDSFRTRLRVGELVGVAARRRRGRARRSLSAAVAAARRLARADPDRRAQRSGGRHHDGRAVAGPLRRRGRAASRSRGARRGASRRRLPRIVPERVRARPGRGGSASRQSRSRARPRESRRRRRICPSWTRSRRSADASSGSSVSSRSR